MKDPEVIWTMDQVDEMQKIKVSVKIDPRLALASQSGYEFQDDMWHVENAMFERLIELIEPVVGTYRIQKSQLVTDVVRDVGGGPLSMEMKWLPNTQHTWFMGGPYHGRTDQISNRGEAQIFSEREFLGLSDVIGPESFQTKRHIYTLEGFAPTDFYWVMGYRGQRTD